MTPKEFLQSKGYDEVPEGLFHVFYQHEIELLLNEFAALPCSCEGGNYGYGAAKCFTCGRVKEVENDGHFIADKAKPQKITETKHNGWFSVNDALPEPLETVWLSNGKGWTDLGCRVDTPEGWHWAGQNGIIYQYNGEIVAECESDDLDVVYWCKLPKPLCA